MRGIVTQSAFAAERTAVESNPMTAKEKLRAQVDELSEAEAASARIVVERTADRDEIGEAIAAGYRRIPQSTPDEWGDLSKLTESTTAQTFQRLDAEERAAGLDPW